MAEEKKTSTKADAKSEKTAKAAKSKDKKKSKKILLNPLRHSSKVLRQRAKRLFGHLQRTSLKTPLLFLL